MEPRDMFDTPFMNINDQGVLGVFGENVSKKIVERIKQINKNAEEACSRTAPPELKKGTLEK
jgi:hypothetical protein